MREDLAACSVNLRHAAKGVGILDSVAVGVRCGDLSSVEEACEVVGGGDLSWVGAQGVETRVEGAVGGSLCLHGERPDDVGLSRETFGP